MKYNNIIKIALLSLMIVSPENTCATTWGEYLWSWMPSQQSAAQLATRLSTQWTNLTPTQQKVAIGATVAALGCTGVCLYKKYQEYQQKLKAEQADLLRRKRDFDSEFLKRDNIVLILANENQQPWELALAFRSNVNFRELAQIVITKDETLLLKNDGEQNSDNQNDYNQYEKIDNLHILTHHNKPKDLLFTNQLYPEIIISKQLFTDSENDPIAIKVVRDFDGSLDLQKLNQDQQADEVTRIQNKYNKFLLDPI